MVVRHPPLTLLQTKGACRQNGNKTREIKVEAKETKKKAPEVTKEQVAEAVTTPSVDNNVPEPAPESDPETEDVKETATDVETLSLSEKTVTQLADEVARGVYGSGRERMISLGHRYAEVQKELNRRFRNK